MEIMAAEGLGALYNGNMSAAIKRKFGGAQFIGHQCA
jgi:hypothetical protein